MKFVLSAGLALASWVALATDATVSEDFEDENYNGTWSTTPAPTTLATAGTVDVGSKVNPSAAALPAQGSKVNPISGTVTFTTGLATGGNYAQTDFLLYVEEAADAPDADDTALSNCQVAVAAGPELTADSGKSEIYVYCSNGTSVAWVQTGREVATGAWYRVTMNFDYINKKAQININGIALNSNYGTTTAAGTSKGGSWYSFATSPDTAFNVITSVAFVGSTQIDDVSASTTAAESDYAFNKTVTSSEASVPYSYFAKYSIDPTTENIATADMGGSGMTIGQKYVTGLDPTTATTFKAASMKSVWNNGSTTGVNVTIPIDDDNGQTYTILVNGAALTGAYAEIDVDSDEPTNGSKTIFVPLDDDVSVNTIQIKAVK